MEIDLEVPQSVKLTAVEFFDDDSIECLNYPILIKELFEDISLKYRRPEIKDKSLLEKYDIKLLPSMLFFRNGKLVGKMQGYYYNNAKKDMIEQVNEIISSA